MSLAALRSASTAGVSLQIAASAREAGEEMTAPATVTINTGERTASSSASVRTELSATL